MQITAKLSGPLRKEIEGLVEGEITVELPEGTMISGAIEALGLAGKVRMLMLNGKAAMHDTELKDGDRLALLPPALAFNMYVATGFLAPEVREEIRNKLKEKG
jgi:sulfur carrier protein ThiS